MLAEVTPAETDTGKGDSADAPAFLGASAVHRTTSLSLYAARAARVYDVHSSGLQGSGQGGMTGSLAAVLMGDERPGSR